MKTSRGRQVSSSKRLRKCWKWSKSGCVILAGLHANCQTPAKKSKLHPLTQDQKRANRLLARKRILIENIIRKLKIFRILSERYRNRRKRFGLRFNRTSYRSLTDFYKRSIVYGTVKAFLK